MRDVVATVVGAGVRAVVLGHGLGIGLGRTYNSVCKLLSTRSAGWAVGRSVLFRTTSTGTQFFCMTRLARTSYKYSETCAYRKHRIGVGSDVSARASHARRARAGTRRGPRRGPRHGTSAAYLAQLGVDGRGIDDKHHTADLALKLGQAEAELLVPRDVHDVQWP